MFLLYFKSVSVTVKICLMSEWERIPLTTPPSALLLLTRASPAGNLLLQGRFSQLIFLVSQFMFMYKYH